MAKKKIDEVEQEVVTFTKEQILASKRYSNRKDVLGVILTDKKGYTLDQVDSLLEKFLKGKVM